MKDQLFVWKDDILFEQIIMLPQRGDLVSVEIISAHHVEFCVQSDLNSALYSVEVHIGLNCNFTPMFQVAFNGTEVLNHPLMDGEDTHKVTEFFKQMILNEEYLTDSLHMCNQESLRELLQEVEKDANDIH